MFRMSPDTPEIPSKREFLVQRVHQAAGPEVPPAPTVLQLVDVVVAVGDIPNKTFQQFTQAAGRAPIPPIAFNAGKNRAACWFTREAAPPFPMEVIHARAERITPPSKVRTRPT